MTKVLFLEDDFGIKYLCYFIFTCFFVIMLLFEMMCYNVHVPNESMKIQALKYTAK